MIKKISNLLSENFINQVYIVFFVNLTNATNFFLQIILARNLEAIHFNDIYTSYAVVTILTSLFSATHLYFQKNYIFLSKKNFSFTLGRTLKFFYFINLIIFLFLFFFLNSKFLATHFKNLIFIYLLFLFGSLSIIPTSILYATQKYKENHIIIFFVNILRFLVIYFSINFFFITSRFVLSINLVFLIITGIFLTLKIYKNLSIKKIKEGFIYDNDKNSISYKRNYDYLFFIFYSIFIPIFLNIDLIFAKIFFNEFLVSNYIIIANLAKIIFILPNILLMYIFNEVNLKKKKIFYSTKFKNLILFFILNLFILFFLFFFIEDIILHFYEAKFLFLKDCFFILFFSFLLLGFSQLTTNFLISQNNKKFIILYIFSLIIYFILTYFNNDTPILLAYNLLCSTTFLFLSLLFYFKTNYNFSKI